MSVEPFRSVLAGLGLDPTPREVAEILWLATRLPAAPSTAAADVSEPDSPQPPAAETADDTLPQPPEEKPAPVATPEVPVYAPAPAPAPGDANRPAAKPVRLAADPLLPRQLELLRALRPLKRRVPSSRVAEFDEEATLESMAQRSVRHRKGTLLPVLRPSAERWLDAVLVVDGHPTGLLLWSPLAREVHRLLIQLGAFRDVRLRYLHTRPDGSPGLSALPAPRPDRIRGTSEIHAPAGRRLVLVLTDGVAPGWQNPAVREALRQWAATGPLVVLQALPERLWSRTALPAVPARLRRAPHSAANTDLVYSGRRRGKRELPAGSIPVPVLELSPQWLKPWAQLVAGAGSPVTDAAVTLLAAEPGPAPAVTDARSPERRLQDFHATATPQAFRLLACLSAVPLTVAIMRVVQAAMLPGTPPTVLAEVLFSGLITPTATDGPTAPADAPHDFLPGVRAALLESLRAHEVDQILREVARFVERGGAVAGRVSGLLPDPTGDAELSADGLPWALLREEALLRAGLTVPPMDRAPSSTADHAEHAGHADRTVRAVPTDPAVRGADNPYRLSGIITIADFSDVHLGIDADGNRAVVKTQPRYTELGPAVFHALLRVEAEALRRMAGRFAPPLLGIDPDAEPTWLAMGYVTSVTGRAAPNLIHGPWSGNGPADDFHALSLLARRLAEALDRAHTAGIVHGNLSPHAVLVVPDTVVLISWVYAQFDGRPHPFPQYRERATGYQTPEGYPQDAPLDPSFDIYGLGAILLREATRDSVLSPYPRALSRLPSHLGGLRTLIGRCLDPDPRQRPTARQIIDELGELAASREAEWTEAPAGRRGSWQRLVAMPGLGGLQRFLERLRAETEAAEELRALGLPGAVDRVNPHLVFIGNPSTEMTTAAALVGVFCRDLGLLSRGHVVQARGSDLVGHHVGATAILMDDILEHAVGGVLFINEAHELLSQTGQFDGEATSALLGAMETEPRRTVVILAGSPERMRDLLAADQGFARRFPPENIMEFPDLDTDTLMTTLEGRIEERGLRLDEEAEERLRLAVAAMLRMNSEDFANASDTPDLADAVIQRWVYRVGASVEESVTVGDIPDDYGVHLPHPEPDPSALLAELARYVGMQPVREVLEDLTVAVRVRQALDDSGVTPPHMVFTGPPGTGKSTVARLVGRLFHDLGLLRGRHCVEVTRADLVAPHVGQTAQRVQHVVRNALDGVLFIDEAYSLGPPREGEGGFGAEAIDALVREMENRRGRLCVIVAGRPREMDAFMAANPGLASRFGTHVSFPDHDTEDLVEILRRMAAERGYVLAPGVPPRAAAWLDAVRLANPSGFENARTVRRLLDLMETYKAPRHHRAPPVDPSLPSRAEFLPEDVPEPPPTWPSPG
ncbi:SAV_2336 N-terminal domain-related protein [Streptomyces sp. AS02]|uniref:SAV_2336 N-terminal domain-related protein n=1 Tax=Streptomyces sp. AS02 TaxID=2938946 RepID=UPI002020170B|nr:SAV_2336 N-terminal domain-related protein [Streptomyces sp. AS02]MCL8016314.1 AAA family ATPase [Streptomyces sp. AS02]